MYAKPIQYSDVHNGSGRCKMLEEYCSAKYGSVATRKRADDQ